MSVNVGILARNAYELYVSVAALGGIDSRKGVAEIKLRT